MGIASVCGADLYYETHGASGDPTVLVHGSLVDHHNWDAVVDPLAHGLQILTYDRRGYGRSSGPPRLRAVRDDAGDLAGLLEATGLYPAHIVTHSYAGAVALRLAVERPELVRSLSMHEPPMVGLLDTDPVSAVEGHRLLEGVAQVRELLRKGAVEVAARAIVQAFSVQEGAWERLRPEVRRMALRHAVQWGEEFADPEAVAPDLTGVGDVLVPVLLTTGEQSPRFLKRISSALAASLRNATETTIPDAGHAPQVTSPDQYVGILLTFLLERNVPTI
jgi:pimeloyl-ACP methyl ester carboxylesterase